MQPSRRWLQIGRRNPLMPIALFTLIALAVLLSWQLAGRVSATLICENGTVISDPDDHPALVADCEALLEAKDSLRGTAELNWNGTTALGSWHGVRLGTVEGVRRVIELNMDGRGLTGTIPAALGRLTGLSRLQLAWRNQLTGSIPAELGKLTRLTYLNLAANRLTGPIPPELGAIGPQLTDLILSGPRPLPSGVGLSGSIPAQLGNLTGLQTLYLNGNRLSGSIPTRLGRLTKLEWLYLTGNQLSGSIPTQIGDMTNLKHLLLEHNSLSGVLPSQLGALSNLSKVYLSNNAGFTGCVASNLRRVRFNDLVQLGLSDCAADADPTPATPEPTFTLTVIAGEGGTVVPSGVNTYAEGAEVSLTTSWNDATHSFDGWTGDCTGVKSTCDLGGIYSDFSVGATFTALAADRCSSPTDADCIRAVYLGAPEDYAQVSDIPADKLLSPDSDGRYQVERGQQVTVVTAARLPDGYNRFYLRRHDVNGPTPTSQMRLIPPVGTTYTFAPIEFEGASSNLTFDLHAARTRQQARPGHKPQLGAIVVSTRFVLMNPIRFLTPRPLADVSYKTAIPPGTYTFPRILDRLPPLVMTIPTTTFRIIWEGTLLSAPDAAYCLSDTDEQGFICINVIDATVFSRRAPLTESSSSADVSMDDVWDFIAESARIEQSAK